ncbi:MAG TPA: hypothetical protein VIJ18_01425 [Microbacteriaceae bacterium]
MAEIGAVLRIAEHAHLPFRAGAASMHPSMSRVMMTAIFDATSSLMMVFRWASSRLVATGGAADVRVAMILKSFWGWLITRVGNFSGSPGDTFFCSVNMIVTGNMTVTGRPPRWQGGSKHGA